MGGQEERELCFRIRSIGYQIKSIEIPMEYEQVKDVNMTEAEEKAGYYIGVGQVLQKYKLSKITKELLWARKKTLIETLIIIFAPIWILLSAIIRYPILIVSSLIIICLFLALILYKGPSKVFTQVKARIIIFFSIIKGFKIGIAKAETFDKIVRVEIIKK